MCRHQLEKKKKKSKRLLSRYENSLTSCHPPHVKTPNISGGLSLSEIKHDEWPAAVTGRTGERPLEGQTQHGALMGRPPPRMTGRHEGRPICRKKRFENISEEEKKTKTNAQWLSGASWCHAAPDESWTSGDARSRPQPTRAPPCLREGRGGRQDYSEPVHSHLSSFLFQFSEGLRTCHKNRKLFKHAA